MSVADLRASMADIGVLDALMAQHRLAPHSAPSDDARARRLMADLQVVASMTDALRQHSAEPDPDAE